MQQRTENAVHQHDNELMIKSVLNDLLQIILPI
jgi:hypothetical protein